MLAKLVGEGQEATGALPGNLRLWDQDARALLRLLPAASGSLNSLASIPPATPLSRVVCSYTISVPAGPLVTVNDGKSTSPCCCELSVMLTGWST